MEKLTLNEIECPVCLDYMTSPIILCIRGHNICGTCRNQLRICPLCKGGFGSQNRALEAVATKLNSLCINTKQNNNCPSALDVLDKYKKRNTISEEIGHIIVSELKCNVCETYTFAPIYFCVNGHSTCKTCRKCTKCCGVATDGRNFALERIAKDLEYPCPYKNLGCSFILTSQQAQHELVCEYRSYSCPLSDVEAVRCSWAGTLESLKLHLQQAHVSCQVYEYSTLTINIMYTSNTVIFTLGEIFVISVVIKNGAVFYRMHVMGSRDTSKFRCTHVFLLNDQVITTHVLVPSPNWLEFSGGMFMDCMNSHVSVHISICKT